MSQGKGSEERGVRFVPAKGSVIGGIRKEKTERSAGPRAPSHLDAHGELRELRDPNAGLEEEWLLPVRGP